MGGGGKSQTTTQQVSIPPEVLARYNAVNARAESVAGTPFQQYGTTPEAFVAPLTGVQRAGISQTIDYGQSAQPYFGAATQQLQQAQQQGQQGLAGAYPFMQQGIQAGQQLGGQAYGAYQNMLPSFMPSFQQAQQGIQQGLGAGQALLGGATGYTLAGAQPITPQQFSGQAVGQYMSPFLSNVVGQTMAAQNQQNAIQRNALTGDAIKAGAFGGDRAGIAQANLAYQQNLANQKTIADLLQGGYGQALGAFQQQQGVNLAAEQANRAALAQTGQGLAGLGQQAFGMGTGAAQQQAALGQALAGLYGQQAQGVAGLGQQQFGQGLTAAQQQAQLAQMGYGMGAGTAQALAGLGQGAQAAGLQGAQAMLQAGTLEQQTEQAGKQALYNQFLQQQGYPFQVAQFLANIAMGTGALSGSTTTTTQPSPFFSDRKLKEGIRKIGETEDGLPIYRFRYKGEDKDQTHIGYMADEVEKKHPDAVGEYGGAKYVDYNKVNARESMGGAVHEGLGRAAYADGGPSETDLQRLQQKITEPLLLYAPASGQAAPHRASAAQSMPHGASYVPQGGVYVSKPIQPASAPRQQQSGFEQSMSQMDKAAQIGEKLIGKYDPNTKSYRGGVFEQVSSLGDKAKGLMPSNDTASVERSASSYEDEKPIPAAHGGIIPRQHFKFGGEDMYKAENSYVPQDVLETDDKKPELMTAKGGTGGGSGGGKSGLGTAVGLAGKLVSLIPGVGTAVGTGMQLASAFMADGGVVPRDGYQQGGPPDMSDEEYAIRTAAAEMSRSADPQEALGIMSTIHNRRESGRYGNTYRDVVLAPNQFEPWQTTNNNPMNIKPDDPRYAAARQAYSQIQEKGVPEDFKDVHNFWGPASQAALGREAPSWGRVGGRDYGGTRFHTLSEIEQSRGMPREGGVGGAKQQVASAQERTAQPPGASQPSGGLGDLLTSSRFWAPIGTGLFAMASSPSIRPGGAILQGIGAGLAAMQPAEERAQRIEQQRLQNVGTGLGLVGKSFVTIAGMPHAIMPGDKILSYTEWVNAGRPMPKGGVAAAKELEEAGQQWARTSGASTAAGTAGGAPATPPKVDIGAQEPPKVQTPQEQLAKPQAGVKPTEITVPPAVLALASKEEQELQSMMPADRELRIAQNTKIQNQAIETRRAAYDMTPQLLDLAIPLSNMEAGQQITPGAWSKFKAFLAGQVNAGVDTLMADQPAAVRKQYYLNSEGLTDYQLAQKAVALIREGKADALGQRAVQSLQVLAEGLADPSKQAGTIRELLAASLMEKQKALEESLFTMKYGQGRTNMVGRDAATAFGNIYNDRMYYDESQKIKDLLSRNVNGVPMVSYLTGKGRLDPEMAKRLTPEAINNYYGFDIARYFTRGVQ